MNLNIEMTEDDLKKFILKYFKEKLGPIPIEINEIVIEVKSKQNYKSEWEAASFRARLNKFIMEK